MYDEIVDPRPPGCRPEVKRAVTSERPIPVIRAARGRIEVPPSKSLTQRALIAASLAAGRSRVRNPLLADDSTLLIAALNAVGIATTIEGSGRDREIVVDGASGVPRVPPDPLQVGNAGTTMRFLTARLAIGDDPCRIDGSERMHRRPIEELLQSLRDLGASAVSVPGNGCPPVRVGGSGLPGGKTRLAGGRSSQFLSALLLAAPSAGKGVEITIEGDLVSRPYVELTLDVMRRFGIVIETGSAADGKMRYRVAAGERYRPADLAIEGDYSAASYFFAAAAITGGRIEVGPLDPASRQGDAGLLSILERMGCRIERRAASVIVEGSDRLRGIEADLRDLPDVAPALAVIALFGSGPTRIFGVPHLRLKESDRIAALVAEIRRLGGEAEEAEDGLTITPRPLRGARIETYLDHRMAMAFAVAGLRIPGTVIRDPGCVSKSFPDFWGRLDTLAARSA